MTPDRLLPVRSDWLYAFAQFAEQLNFTRAARSLHLSQPALHVQIAKLSAELGVTLYTRHGRGLALTREGQKLLAFARETAERDAAFVTALRGEEGTAPVVLAAGEGVFLYLLGEALRAFAQRARAPLRLLTRNHAGTTDAILAGEAHLGVASLDVVPDGVVAEALCDVGQVVVLPRTHPLARKRALSLGDLEGAALVVPPAGRPHRAMIARALQAAGVGWTVAAEANGWELLVHFASLGLGLAIVNAFCRLPRGTVARPLRGLPSVRYALLSREGATLRREVQALKTLLAAKVARTQA
jgi:LysR family transcriptional regulator, low CO2-responsive transcriptional regulator